MAFVRRDCDSELTKECNNINIHLVLNAFYEQCLFLSSAWKWKANVISEKNSHVNKDSHSMFTRPTEEG